MYTFELCKSARQRAIAGTILSLLGNGATLVIYIFGLFVEWRMLAAISTVFCFPYIAGILFLFPSKESSPDCSGYMHLIDHRIERNSYEKIKFYIKYLSFSYNIGVSFRNEEVVRNKK